MATRSSALATRPPSGSSRPERSKLLAVTSRSRAPAGGWRRRNGRSVLGIAAGTPSWVDVGSTDLDVTHAFYTGLFGWERQDAGPPEETGGYGFYTKGGRAVAGYGPAQAPGVWWTMYVRVDDAAAIADRVEANGGTTMVPPMAVMDQGTMAVFADPTGAAFSVWQPDQMNGAAVVNEPGAFSWAELMTATCRWPMPSIAPSLTGRRRTAPTRPTKSSKSMGASSPADRPSPPRCQPRSRRTGTSTSA